MLPGIMGSELRLGDEVIWPGPASSLLLEFKRTPDLLRPNLVATDVPRSFGGAVSIYETLILDLEVCGFHEMTRLRTLHVVPYDWRKSNYEAAGILAKRLDDIRGEHGGELTITLSGPQYGRPGQPLLSRMRGVQRSRRIRMCAYPDHHRHTASERRGCRPVRRGSGKEALSEQIAGATTGKRRSLPFHL
jgi:hypothetical protein